MMFHLTIVIADASFATLPGRFGPAPWSER